jgi:hypothetical protein
VLFVSSIPAKMVYFDVSEVKIPVEITVNANTEATTTNAIRIIAVSNPVMPRCDDPRVTILNIRSGSSTKHGTRMGALSALDT